jgi:hypothetical protein
VSLTCGDIASLIVAESSRDTFAAAGAITALAAYRRSKVGRVHPEKRFGHRTDERIPTRDRLT